MALQDDFDRFEEKHKDSMRETILKAMKNNMADEDWWKATDEDLDKAADEILALLRVSQQRELSGCQHTEVRLGVGKYGTCNDCGIDMIKTWQPYCG